MKGHSFLFAVLAVGISIAHAGTVAPDSQQGNLTVEVSFAKLPALVPVLLTPTNDGSAITNANGDQVIFGATAGLTGKCMFSFKKSINNLNVTDFVNAHGKPGQKLDPGYSYDSEFTDGVMNTDLSAWLVSQGYTDVTGNSIVVPDFLGVTLDNLYYGIDYATLLNDGVNFENNYSVGQDFSIDSSGEHISALPEYLFSATPLVYVSGEGWTGTPLPVGTEVEFSNDHSVQVIVPEPGCLSLGLGAFGLLAARKRR